MARVTRPLLLDAFCCEGGASTGYHQAGFDVIGVDIAPQPNYPYRFVQADALEVLSWLVNEGVFPPGLGLTGADARRVAAIHASPPCQARTTMSNRWRGAGGRADEHVNLIPPTRELLSATARPWVLENVAGARRDLPNAFVLHGGMFGLRVDRPRLFESNVLIMSPTGPRTVNPIGVYGKAHDGRLLFRRADGTEQRAAASLDEAREAMGMPWATWRGCAEAIPPAYTAWIGEQLLEHVAAAA